jgi:DNA-binding FrmR family transcriptional regulator
MSQHHSNAAIVKRLKRANGHLTSIIGMLEVERNCIDIAQQLQAVEAAIHSAKKTLIHEHIGHCLLEHSDPAQALEEFHTIAKYL